jgi:hypothetical protein
VIESPHAILSNFACTLSVHQVSIKKNNSKKKCPLKNEIVFKIIIEHVTDQMMILIE